MERAPTPGMVLVRLAGGPALTDRDLAAFTAWETLAALASDHRVEPLLHWRHADRDAIPAALRARWATAHRKAAHRALLTRAVLLRTVALLERRGHAVLALKGAWLAWRAWPEAALRPMRDIDLLARPGAAAAVQQALLAEGFTRLHGGVADAAEAHLKHLAPLLSPEGIAIEIHQRLWDQPGLPAEPAGLFARAVADPEHAALITPHPTDMAMHLALHAVAHRFDGGPLMLADFGWLADRVDWDDAFARAGAQGWARALALCLAGARRWGGPEAQTLPAPPEPVPETAIAALPVLLARPAAAREGDIAAGKLASGGGLIAAARKALARRRRFARLRDWTRWLVEDARGILAARSDTGARARLAALREIEGFLAP